MAFGRGGSSPFIRTRFYRLTNTETFFVNIQEEKTSELLATVRIQIAREDYAEKLENSLKDLGKKVQIKGFRPGKVPKTMVRKFYGNEVLARELDSIINEQLNSFIKEKQLRILGQPLPKEDQQVRIDINDTGDYEFAYELGLSPEFEISALNENTRLERKRIEPDQSAIDDEWNRVLKQEGQLKEVSSVEAGDLLYMKLVELDEQDQIKPDGIYKDVVLEQDKIKNEALASQCIGMSPGQTMIFENFPEDLGRDRESVLRYMFGIRENMDQVGNRFRAELTGIKRNVPAEFSQALLDKVFGEGRASSEEEARKLISEEIARAYNMRTDREFNDTLSDHLLEHTSIPLPEEFLRRWLQSQQEENEVIGDFEFFLRNLKWSLIYNKVARDNELNVSQDDIHQAVLNDIRRHYGAAFEQLEEEDLNDLVQRLASDKEYVKKVHTTIMDARVFEVLRQKITIVDQPLSMGEYQRALMEGRS